MEKNTNVTPVRGSLITRVFIQLFEPFGFLAEKAPYRKPNPGFAESLTAGRQVNHEKSKSLELLEMKLGINY
jgi:hypothetical protein